MIYVMSYLGRLGSHSTSDDQTRYQDMAEVNVWKENYFPLSRLQGYLEARGLWDENKEQELVSEIDEDIRTAMKRLDLFLGRMQCTICMVSVAEHEERKSPA